MNLVIGSIDGNRTIGPISPRSRRRCHCGCKTRASHIGMGDGVALMQGCEFYVRVWVRDGIELCKREMRQCLNT